MNHLGQRRIDELIHENYMHASVLFFFGISFYNYSDKTLAEVCKDKGLDLDTVVKNLNSCNEAKPKNIALQQFPIDLIIEYLKHSHYIFIKKKLPFISTLVSTLDQESGDKVGRELQFVFPYFVEDFIKHVYEEEDTLFSYILALHAVSQKKMPISKVYFEMEKNSIRDYALAHTMDDDEMQGIRTLTNNYRLTDPSDLRLKVIFEELKAFEAELKNHAQIENEILFPKALSLETEVNLHFKSLIPRN